MSKLSRRSFLKGTAVSALGAAALGMTACISKETQNLMTFFHNTVCRRASA